MAESQNKRDLAHARTKINFDVKDMTNFLHGGEANVEQRRYIIDLIAKDPIFNKDDWYVCFVLLLCIYFTHLIHRMQSTVPSHCLSNRYNFCLLFILVVQGLVEPH
jgi:hypothetical protein